MRRDPIVLAPKSLVQALGPHAVDPRDLRTRVLFGDALAYRMGDRYYGGTASPRKVAQRRARNKAAARTRRAQRSRG